MTLLDVLIVQLDDLRIGLSADVVHQIIAAAAIAPLPSGPSVVEGVLNVHGALVPVLDMRARFGLRAIPLDPDQHFVIADAGARRVALRVDRALHMASLGVETFEPADRVAPGVAHVSALVKAPDGVVLIHDLEQFLSLDEVRTLDDALEASREAQVDSAAKASVALEDAD